MAGSRALELGALIVAVAALSFTCFTWTESQQAEHRTALRLEGQERQEVASKVYLGEAPKYAYDKFKEDGSPVRWVVINFSTTQVVNVWVDGADGRSIIIDRVQACTLYGLPYGFEPEVLYFEDSYGKWHVPRQGLAVNNGQAPPQQDTDDSDKWIDVRNCP